MSFSQSKVGVPAQTQENKPLGLVAIFGSESEEEVLPPLAPEDQDLYRALPLEAQRFYACAVEDNLPLDVLLEASKKYDGIRGRAALNLTYLLTRQPSLVSSGQLSPRSAALPPEAQTRASTVMETEAEIEALWMQNMETNLPVLQAEMDERMRRTWIANRAPRVRDDFYARIAQPEVRSPLSAISPVSELRENPTPATFASDPRDNLTPQSFASAPQENPIPAPALTFQQMALRKEQLGLNTVEPAKRTRSPCVIM